MKGVCDSYGIYCDSDDHEVQCDYCGELAELVTGKRIYPHRKDLYDRYFYLCKPCDAYVGTHKNTTIPLGRLANSELRLAKMFAHRSFDPLWKTGQMNRSKAYRWLARQLDIDASECHIGMFTIAQCRKVAELCDQYMTTKLFEELD